jgi:hypothetical protein
VQNIVIHYRVDKSEVDKSNQSVQKARDLTDQLKKSSQQFTDQGTKGNKQYATSIESVKQRMAQLRVQIDLTARSDTKRLTELITQYKQAKAEVDRFNASLKDQKNTSTQAATSFNGMAGGMMNFVSALRAAVAVAFVKELVETTLEAAKLSGQVEAVGNAFRRQIPAAETLLYNLRKATKGTVSDIELMQRALRFQQFGASVEALPNLLEFAAVRAQQTGESVDYMVNSIVDGIGRKSLRILDNLKLSATDIKKEMHGVSMESASVAQVSEAMGRIAARELEKMGGLAENSATAVDQLAVSWRALREEIAALITSLGGDKVAPVLREYVESFKVWIESMRRGVAVSDVFAEKQRKEAAQITANEFAQNVLNKSKEENIKLLEDEIARITSLLGHYAKEKASNDEIVAALREQFNARKGNQYVIEENIKAQENAIKTKTEDALLDQEILRLLQEKLIAYKKQNDAQNQQIVTIKTLRDKLEELQKQREEATSIGNKGELDRLQREILLLEDRILRISDNIAWQKKWDQGTDMTKFHQEQLTEALEDQKKAIDDLSKTFLPQESAGVKVDFSNLDEGADLFRKYSYELQSLERQLTKTMSPQRRQKLIAEIESLRKSITTLGSNLEIPVEISPNLTFKGEKWTRFKLELKEAFKQAEQELTAGAIDISAGLIQSTFDLEVANYQARLNQLQNFYSEQQSLAGDNERYKEALRVKEQRDTLKLQKEMARKQKQARLAGIIIDTAASAAKTAAQLGFPAAIPFIALALAQGAVQYSIASKQPDGFKDGVIDLKGPGTAKSDSIHARLSKGESVMTAEETQSSMKTLKMIRAKKLNDKVLERIASKATGRDGGVFDDSRLAKIMSEVAKNTAQSDVIQKGSFVYEVKSQQGQFKQYIRSKSL